MELPELNQFYEKNHKADSDFEILAIRSDDHREDATSGAIEAKFPFRVLLDFGHDIAEFDSAIDPTLV